MSSKILEVKNLVKSFPLENTKERLQVLKDVSVTVNKGEIFGFIGLSGAGKTSLARCVSALEKADSGEILFNGVDITKLRGRDLRETRKKMGLVFQHFNLLMNSTVYENIAFPLRISKYKNIRERVDELLEIVGLTEKANVYPATLSGGQKQRVGIARALAASPELVICDEATSALDPDTTRSILALIKKIAKDTGVTFLVITHEMDVIKELCTHVAIMEDGKIIEEGPVLQVVTQPQTDTAKRFFSKEYVDASWLKATHPHAQYSSKICRAVFIGDVARQTIMSDVIRKYDIELSILSGNIESVGGTMLGLLIIEIIGTDDKVLKAIDYFRNHGIGLEVIDHV